MARRLRSGRTPFLAGLALAFSVVSGMVAVPVTIPAAAAAGGGDALRWRPCYQEEGPFECATLRVPLDHDRPRTQKISIALIRQPAADPSQRLGSIVLNPGGPGGSGVDFVRGAGPFLFTEEVRAKFDLVGFDPRGIIRSEPLRCFRNERQWEPYFTPFAFPTTPEEIEVWIAADRYLLRACDRRAGRIIDHMATADVARDMDLLRQALGEHQLNYVGYSYGSYLGVTYANLFPDRFRSLVVDGVLDPVQWATGEGDTHSLPVSSRLGSHQGAQSTLDEFFRLCDAALAVACAFAPDSASRFAAVADRLKSDPIDVVDPDTGEAFELNYSVLIAITAGAMYDSLSWPDFAGLLAVVEANTDPAATGAALSNMQDRLQVARRADPPYQNFVEGFPGVLCTDSDNPDSYDAWIAAGEAADQTSYFGRYWTWLSSLCAEWRGEDHDRYTGPFSATTASAVLVVGNHFDPATPYEGAVAVADLMPNSRLLTVAGWGHTSLGLSVCADEAVARYLVDGALPVPGAVCAQDVVPFIAPGDAEVTVAAAESQAAKIVHTINSPSGGRG